MEEFTQKQPVQEEVILDEGTKKTVEPLHQESQVQGEQSSAEIAYAHANGPAIGNFEGDIEVTGNQATTLHPAAVANQRAAELLEQHKSAAPPARSAKLPVSIIVVSVMIGMLLFFLLYR